VAGLPTIPDAPVPDAVIHQIRAAAGHAGIALAAISGTFNAAHPDPAYRQTHLDRFRHLCAAASDLQIDIITLSSGSRDPDDMWRWHPDNTTAQAWADSRTTLQALAALAKDYGLTLAVEPEHSNVVATAEQAIMMLDQVASPPSRSSTMPPTCSTRTTTTHPSLQTRSPATSPLWDRTLHSPTPRSSLPTAPQPPQAPGCCPGR
jgi:sugar phosphate isomerase/epimerase